MDHHQRVAWSEGMFLTPHHFQQWDRYYENVLNERVKSLHPLDWGIRELRIDTDALANGELALPRCSAVLPDGLMVNIPDDDDVPESRPIEPHHDPKKEAVEVFLVAPLKRVGSVACVTEDGPPGRPVRYRRKFVALPDENTGTREREVGVAAKQLKILFGGEPLDDYEWIKIAELTRTATGAFQLRETYIPPCLSMSASPQLAAFLKRSLEVISTRSSDLAKQRRQRSQGLVEFTMSEAANFWFLHTVNSFIPTLAHFYAMPAAHPERVYLALAQLAGELITFAGEGHPKDVPRYLHNNLGETFAKLDDKLRSLLETIIPTRCIPIALEKVKETSFTARIPDEQLLATGSFYLAVMADVPEDKIVKELPFKAKLSSVDRVDRLIAQALRGIVLKHLPMPPAEIPVQPGRLYFQVVKGGEHWDAVAGARAMSIYVPPEFTGLKLEMMAVKE